MTDPLSMLREGLAALGSLFYPPHCAACGCRVEEGEALLCASCRRSIRPPSERCCPVCSHPVQPPLPCPNCEGRRWHLAVIVAGCRHEGLVRELIHRFKYGRDQSLIRPLAELMLPALEDPRVAGRCFDAVVPVPLHPLRERERDFNQSALLARRVARQLGIPVLNLLKRTRSTAPQAGFDRRRRMENLQGAFAVRGNVPPKGTLLLVDDVATTGATLDACAEVLLEEGAAEVCAVTVARG